MQVSSGDRDYDLGYQAYWDDDAPPTGDADAMRGWRDALGEDVDVWRSWS